MWLSLINSIIIMIMITINILTHTFLDWFEMPLERQLFNFSLILFFTLITINFLLIANITLFNYNYLSIIFELISRLRASILYSLLNPFHCIRVRVKSCITKSKYGLGGKMLYDHLAAYDPVSQVKTLGGKMLYHHLTAWNTLIVFH